MRAPLYASSEFPNANHELHAGRIDPVLDDELDDAFGDGELEVVDDLPDLLVDAEVEQVGDEVDAEVESPRESMVRLVAAVSKSDPPSDFDVTSFSSLSLPTLPPLDIALWEGAEFDLDPPPQRRSDDPTAGSPQRRSDAQPQRRSDAQPQRRSDDPTAGSPQRRSDGTPDRLEKAAETSGEADVQCRSEPGDGQVQRRSDQPSDGSIDPFYRLAEVMAAVTDVEASDVAELLSGRSVASGLFGGKALVASGVFEVEASTQSVMLSAKARATAAAWARIVRGEGGDLEACGGKTLDEFAAEVAAALAGDSTKFETMRRALRARGVAAFGLVLDAA